MNLNHRAAVVLLALGLALGVPACGGDPEVCADVDALLADLDDLRAIEVQPGMLADFSAAFDEVEADVDRLVESAASEYEDEIEAVQTATRDLTASVEAVVQEPSRPGITQVSADFGAFTAAVDDLQEAVSGTC